VNRSLRFRSRVYRLTVYASGIVLYLAASGLITPIFATYQGRWHYPPVVTTVVFAAYTLTLLVALLCTGSLSDAVGRRCVLLIGSCVQVAGLVMLAVAPNIGALVAGRAVEGLATGFCLSALGAGPVVEHKGAPGGGARLNTMATCVGTPVGAIGSALLLSRWHERADLPYLAATTLTAIFAVAVWVMDEPS
jgi:MFS family permease